ncbi:MAG: DNA polymerase I [Alphaproteobacteria bacterium]
MDILVLMHHLYLVDGSGFIFRAFHALPPMTRADGTPVNAVFGFCNMLAKLMVDNDADHIAVIFDAGRTCFRNRLYHDYKAHRPPPPPELIPQFALIREATIAFGLPAVELTDFEADDLIATYVRLARTQNAEVTIVSSDKDLMQLIQPNVWMLDPIKNQKLGAEAVMEKFGVPPEKVIEVQALIGDSVDNVPGVPGIGVKTAAQLINEYGDLETLLAHTDEIKQPKRREALVTHAEKARISRQLVELKSDVAVPVALDNFAKKDADPNVLYPWLEQQGFRSLLTRLRTKGLPSTDHATSPSISSIESGTASHTLEPPVISRDHYIIIQDDATLDQWLARIRTAGFVALDIETIDSARGDIAGIALALSSGDACYIPVAHRTSETAEKLALDSNPTPAPQQIALDTAMRALKLLFEDTAILKIAHNAKGPIERLIDHDIRLSSLDDIMLISYALDAGLGGHTLEGLAERHLEHQMLPLKDIVGTGRTKTTFEFIPLETARDYAAERADIIFRLWRILKPRLLAEKMMTIYETIERPLVPVIASLEKRGILVDRNELKRMSTDFAHRLNDLEKEIHRLAGHPFNIGSPKQLGEVLFDELGLPGGKKGKTGAYGTSAEILEDLAAVGHDLPARVLDWRQIAKLKSTYTDALQTQVNSKSGRVHTDFGMAVASTGRLSSTDPNLQNIPIRTEEGRRIRRAFIASPAHKLVSLDYSQIELRLLAHVAEIESLKNAFRDGVDIHALTASQVFGIPVARIDSAVRRSAKAINFGIVYGISAFGLARQLGIDQSEARAYIDAYFKQYPGIRDYMEVCKKRARRDGYVRTLFGRKIHIPDIKDRNHARRNGAERQAINAPLQGTAADIIKRAMIHTPIALQQAGLNGKLLLQVHDELLFEVPDVEIDKTITVMQSVMTEAHSPAITLSVPLVVEAGSGANWDDAH